MDPKNSLNNANFADLQGVPATPPLDEAAFPGGSKGERLVEIKLGNEGPVSAARAFTPQGFDLSPEKSTRVISSAQKFLLPVPAFEGGGEPLVDAQGNPIKDWQGRPIGERGIVVYNEQDRSAQAACGDGQAVIIINQVSIPQAEKLLSKVRSLAADPLMLTLSQVKEILDYARTELALNDMYNSDRGFVAKKMTPVAAEAVPLDASGQAIAAFGLMKRDDRDICLAQYAAGPCTFSGPTATPQLFANGMVVVRVGESIHAVQPEIFAETYRHADGRAIADPAAEVRSAVV